MGRITNEKAVGTGLSGGVDSFYALYRHLDRDEKNFNLTHLVFCNAGTNGDFGGDSARKLFLERKQLLEEVALSNHLKFICVDTNVSVRTLHNCGVCLKCRRTLLDLYAIDKVDDFKNAFDIEYFKKNINYYLYWLVRNRKGTDLPEIYQQLRSQKRIPGRIIIKGYVMDYLLKIKKVIC